MIMNRTSARCVIAHSERLKRFITRLPFRPWIAFEGRMSFQDMRYSRGQSARVDRAHTLAGDELLHAERYNLVAVLHAASDQRRVPGEGRERDRLQGELAIPRDD